MVTDRTLRDPKSLDTAHNLFGNQEPVSLTMPSQEKEAERERVNRWIRSSGAFDGVIDFDRVLRDPQYPGRIAARFASGDHLHPNDSGYRAMALAVDLGLFR